MLFVQLARTPKRAVAADDDEALNRVLAQVRGGLSAALGFEKGQTAGGAQNGAATLDDVGDAARPHRFDVAFDKTLVAAVNGRHVHVFVDGGAHDRANGGVHAGRVAPAGEYGDMLHQLPSIA